MAQTTSPVALDETLQVTNTKLEAIKQALGERGSSGASSWNSLSGKPFSSIGNGLSVVSNNLNVDIIDDANLIGESEVIPDDVKSLPKDKVISKYTFKFFIDKLTSALSGKSDTGHKHSKSDITDFSHTHTKSNITDFNHQHTSSDITDFLTAISGKSDTGHKHTVSDITNLSNATESTAGLMSADDKKFIEQLKVLLDKNIVVSTVDGDDLNLSSVTLNEAGE